MAGVDQLLKRRRRREALLPVRLVHHGGDRCQRVQPDEVSQRERSHRVACAGHHPGVDVLDRADPLLVGADRVEHVGDEKAIDYEAPVVAGGDGRLAQLPPEIEAEVRRLVGRGVGAHNLEKGHHLRRVEEVQAQEALRPRGGGRLVGDGER
jgi:hypothetical protein